MNLIQNEKNIKNNETNLYKIYEKFHKKNFVPKQRW